MKKIVGVMLIASLLTGCSSSSSSTEQIAEDYAEEAVEKPVKLKDGRMVNCLFFYGNHRLAVSCDWANAR